jgi:hypothetical protein
MYVEGTLYLSISLPLLRSRRKNPLIQHFVIYIRVVHDNFYIGITLALQFENVPHPWASYFENDPTLRLYPTHNR